MQNSQITEKLHTDILEEKYGPILAQVLRHDNEVREAHLIDRKGISRTYALTFFTEKKLPKEISVIDKEIRSGVPIGKAFRGYGYVIRKNVIDVYIIKLPDWLRLAFATREEYAKAKISEFYAKTWNKQPFLYGTAIEIYSPDFRQPIITQADIRLINPSTKALESSGIKREDIWKRLGDDNEWSDMIDKYTQAKKETLPHVFLLKERIYDYLDKNH